MVVLMRMLILVVGLIFALETAKAQQISIEVPRYVEISKPFKVEYKVADMNASIEPITLPKADGLTLTYGPVISRVSSTSVVNGKAISSTSQAIVYTFVADKPGRYRIVSPEVRINGRLAKISSAQVEAKKTRLSEQVTFKYLTLPERKQVYEHEAIRVKYQLQGTRPFSLRDLAPTVSDGFIIHRVDMDQYNQIRSERIGGQDWVVVDLAQEIAVAQHVGMKSLGNEGRAVVAYSNPDGGDDLFMQDLLTSSVSSTKSSIEVKPLPEKGKDGFSGAVGSFTIKYELPSRWQTNETTILRVVIEGEGSLQMLDIPKIALPSTFDVYDPIEQTETGYAQGNLSVRHTIEYSIIPRQAGTAILPELVFKYFDPRLGDYRQSRVASQRISIQVGKSSANKSSIIQKANNQGGIPNNGVIYKLAEPYKPIGLGYILIYPLLLGLAYGGYIYIRKYQATRANVVEYAASQAGIRALKALKKVTHQSQGREDIYTQLSLILLRYLSDKFRLPTSDLNRIQIRSALSLQSVSDIHIEELYQILDKIELSRYGLHEQSIGEELLSSIRALILKLEAY